MYLYAVIVAFLSCGSLSDAISTPYVYSAGDSFYVSDVQSYGNISLDGLTYYIESAKNEVASSDLEFMEYADYLEKALEVQGAKRIFDKREAMLCVLLDYSINDNSYNTTVPVPIWGETGISSITTRSNTTGNALGFSSGSASIIGNSIYGSSSGTVYSNSTTTTSTHVNPSYGIKDVVNVERHINEYLREIGVYCYDNIGEEHKMLFKTIITSSGQNNKLRDVFPYMIYCSTSTYGKQVNDAYRIEENDFLYKKWVTGGSKSPFFFVHPKYGSTNVPEGYVELTSIEAFSDCSDVTLLLKENSSWYKISSQLTLEINGREYVAEYCSIPFDKTFLVDGVAYVTFRFPYRVVRGDRIKITEYTNAKHTKKAWEWSDIVIR